VNRFGKEKLSIRLPQPALVDPSIQRYNRFLESATLLIIQQRLPHRRTVESPEGDNQIALNEPVLHPHPAACANLDPFCRTE
jgi:hypothetical protein